MKKHPWFQLYPEHHGASRCSIAGGGRHPKAAQQKGQRVEDGGGQDKEGEEFYAAAGDGTARGPVMFRIELKPRMLFHRDPLTDKM